MSNWFPIKSKNSCLLKWGWSSLYLWTTTSSSCHRVENAKFDLEKFNFHNTPEVIKDRKKMLNGTWPGRGCESCRDQERYGGFSDRLNWLSNEKNKKYVPVELYNNPKQVEVSPTMLEVYFNNKCNMKCMYCGPYLSSAWVAEEKRFSNNNVSIKFDDKEFEPWELDKNYQYVLAKFYQYLEENYKNLREFHILGGEPFIQKETWDCIDWMIDHPNYDLDFELFTNMQIKHDDFKEKVQKLKELTKVCNTVEITASIDCWGEPGEYVRTGLKLSTFEKNMEYLLLECPEIIITMNWTVNSLSIHTTPELIKKVIHWNSIKTNPKPISVNYNKCISPEIFDPHIMPKGVYTSYIQEIEKLNNDMYGSTNTYKRYVDSMFLEIESSPENPEKIKQLITFLDKMDVRRNTDWKKVFPWLIEVKNAIS
jgi:hypothetical protein